MSGSSDKAGRGDYDQSMPYGLRRFQRSILRQIALMIGKPGNLGTDGMFPALAMASFRSLIPESLRKLKANS
jgi:hypothetical protein